MFNKQNVIKSGLQSKLTRLTNKHIGGTNQRKGQRYEDFFAIYKIAENGSAVLKGLVQDAKFLDQAEYCFVDDLIIIKSQNKIEFYQLKNTQTLSWNTEICSDFEDQHRLATHLKKDFSLILVVSSEPIFEKLVKMPSDSFENTFVEYFAEPKNCEDMIRNFEGFSEWMKEISALRNPTTMDLDVLAKTIQSEWINLDTKKFKSIKSLLEKSNRETVPIRTSWSNTKKWKQAEKILRKIPNLEFYTDRGILEFEFSVGKAISKGFYPAKPSSQKLNRFLDKIIKKTPKTIQEFEELL